MKRFLLVFCIIMAIPFLADAKRLHPEKWYQAKWCQQQGGKVEVVLPDRTRADCLTDSHAVEFDFGDKWAEAIGPSLYYAIQTGKRAGVVLILESLNDRKYWIRLNSIIQYYDLPISTWKMGLGAKDSE